MATRTRSGSSISERETGPQGIRVGVGALILDGRDRVLLVKHHPSEGPRKSFWQGKWIGPGGMLEFGEGLEEGARREVREETGLEIDVLRPLTPSDRVIFWEGKKYMQVVYIDFLARVKREGRKRGEGGEGKEGWEGGGEWDEEVVVRPGDDVGVAKWFTRGELEALNDQLHEDTRGLLERAGILAPK